MNRNPFNVINTIVGFTYKEDGTINENKSVSTFYTPHIITKNELVREAQSKKYSIKDLKVSSRRSSKSGV